jgi:ribosomal protein S18 acetylase RimI-like enzyme
MALRAMRALSTDLHDRAAARSFVPILLEHRSSAEPKTPGVGTALFAASRTLAADLGVVAINATIRADNRGGLAYYEKMGFRTYRTLEAVKLQDGRAVDRILKRYLVER